MSITYNVIQGDTFENIARKQYGTEQEAGKIAAANPGVKEPLTPGILIIIPVVPGAPQNIKQQTPTKNENETALLIDGNRFRFWDSVRITRSIDTMDVVEFGAPFDSNIPSFRETFRPFSYRAVEVTVGGDVLFTGTLIGVDPVLENNKKIISASCYSLPGILSDCTPPASAYPLEFNNQGFQEIVKKLVEPFGLSVDFRADQGAIFERVALDPSKKIIAFLIELANQRNLILSSNQFGELLVWKSVTPGKPVARLEQGVTPLLSVSPFFSPQDYYSHITGIQSVSVGLAGSQFTVKNPRLAGIMRPNTFKAPDTIDSTVKLAVESKAGRMFGNMVMYSVRVNTWRDTSGNLWEPNTTVTLIAPDAMIYNNYEFIIRSVSFDKNESTETATLNLVLPGSFSGDIPDTLPWDD